MTWSHPSVCRRAALRGRQAGRRASDVVKAIPCSYKSFLATSKGVVGDYFRINVEMGLWHSCHLGYHIPYWDALVRPWPLCLLSSFPLVHIPRDVRGDLHAFPGSGLLTGPAQ